MTSLFIQALEAPRPSQIKYWDFYAHAEDLFQEHDLFQSEIASTLEQFRCNHYEGAGLEKLILTDFYSLRTNSKHRLFFTTVEEKINNVIVRVAFIFDFHLRHKHDTYAPFKNAGPTMARIEEQRVALFQAIQAKNIMSTHASEAVDEALELALKRPTITYSNAQIIQLEAAQIKGMYLSFPLVVNGGAGTGKTVLLESTARGIKYKLKHLDASYRPKVLIITPTETLASILAARVEKEGSGDVDVFVAHFDLYVKDYLKPEQILVDDTDLHAWYVCLVEQIQNRNKANKYSGTTLFTLENYEKIKQSFYLFAGHKPGDIAKRDIPLKSADSDLKNKLFDKFNAYLAYLAENNKVHPRFFKFPETSEDTMYDALLVDESQEYTFQQLSNVYHAAKRDGVSASCFSFDSHQITDFLFSKRPHLIRMIAADTGIEKPYVHLESNQRSHPDHVALADACVQIKYQTAMGKGDDFEDNHLRSVHQRSDYPQDILTGVDWPKKPRDELVRLKTPYNFDSVDHFIVTHEQYKEEARGLFGSIDKPPAVYSFTEALGSQGTRVVLYRPFDLPEFEQLSKHLRRQQSDAHKNTRPVNTAKPDQGNTDYNPCLNKVISAFQRSLEYLTVYQEHTPDLAFLLDYLRAALKTSIKAQSSDNATKMGVEKKETTTTQTVDSSPETWLRKIRELVLSRSNDVFARKKYEEKRCETLTGQSYVDYKTFVLSSSRVGTKKASLSIGVSAEKASVLTPVRDRTALTDLIIADDVVAVCTWMSAPPVATSNEVNFAFRLSAAMGAIKCCKHLMTMEGFNLLEPGQPSGQIALHGAIRAGHEKIVQLLFDPLKHDPLDIFKQLMIKNKQFETPVQLIARIKNSRHKDAILNHCSVLINAHPIASFSKENQRVIRDVQCHIFNETRSIQPPELIEIRRKIMYFTIDLMQRTYSSHRMLKKTLSDLELQSNSLPREWDRYYLPDIIDMKKKASDLEISNKQLFDQNGFKNIAFNLILAGRQDELEAWVDIAECFSASSDVLHTEVFETYMRFSAEKRRSNPACIPGLIFLKKRFGLIHDNLDLEPARAKILPHTPSPVTNHLFPVPWDRKALLEILKADDVVRINGWIALSTPAMSADLNYAFRLSASLGAVRCCMLLVGTLGVNLLEPGQPSGQTALHRAISGGHKKIVQLLIDPISTHRSPQTIFQQFMTQDKDGIMPLAFIRMMKNEEHKQAIIQYVKNFLENNAAVLPLAEEEKNQWVRILSSLAQVSETMQVALKL